MSSSANTTKNALYRLASALLSGIFLFCSFSPLEWSFCAWLALVPLIILCLESAPGQAFRLGLVSGLAFWLASIFWLTKVSFIGWMAISLYCALYMGVFAMVVSWWSGTIRKVGPDCLNGTKAAGPEALALPIGFFDSDKGRAAASLPRHLILIFLIGIPAIWVGLEFARAHFLTGFAWNMLGVSQYERLNLIQCSEWGGAYLVSYLVVMGNAAIALFMHQNWLVIPDLIGNPENFNIQSELDSRLRGNDTEDACDSHPRLDSLPGIRPSEQQKSGGTGCPALPWNIRRHGFWPAARAPAVFLLVLTLALAYGHFRLSRCPDGPETIRIAGLQLNVPQQQKWSEDWADDIYQRLSASTTAAAGSRPDLIVWPETALPDCVRHDEKSRGLVKETLGRNIPLLAGSMDYSLAPDGTNFYNSAFLYLPGHHHPQVYNKRHLVAFGEFIPFARFFPFLRSITGIEEDFTSGSEVVVFSLADPRRLFSVLICFEDTLPYLARDCVRAGARLLVNQTNDAWFDPSWASRQQMIQCVFRCIENRVGCLRVTNTGVTCLIDRRGKLVSELAPLGSQPRAPEVLNATATFAPAEMPLTFYTRRGDIFALACAAFSLPLLLGVFLSVRRKK